MKNLIKSKLFLQVIVASMVATLATVGIVAASTTIGTNISTGGTLTVTGNSNVNGLATTTASNGNIITRGSLMATSTLLVDGNSYLNTISSGTWNGSVVGVAYGGTGWATINANTLLMGNGTGAIATTSAGTNGYILALSAGVPSWVATSSFAATGANGDITSLTAITSIDRSGALSIAGTNATLTIGRATATTTFAGGTVFTGITNFAGMATTTAAGAISPGRYPTGATPTCTDVQEGAFLWNSSKKETCVCSGVSWVLATTTPTTACF